MQRSLLISACVVTLGCVSLFSCGRSNGSAEVEHTTVVNTEAVPYRPDAAWNAYWYSGKAELTSYTLQQNRYGELHSGTAVNIFVTEDFSKAKQVKLDNPGGAGADKLPVLKLNQSIKFNTGIYPYSLMLSAFQPIDVANYPHAVKLSGSVQEWCGMAYFQLNDRNDKFQIVSNSYFESEGDRTVSIEHVLQEDALWNIIRLQPAALPVGKIDILPGALYLRLAHKDIAPVSAKASITENSGVKTYTVDMPSLNRTLSIRFESAFPYRILGWEDSYPGFDGKVLTTKAERNKELILDYWRTHGNADRVLREQLGLPKDTQ